jgi:peptidoglycan/xylan/chitin deacetylase (PgdA/CDA1 family)
MQSSFSWPFGKRGAIVSSWDDGIVTDKRLLNFYNKNNWHATWAISSGFLGQTRFWPGRQKNMTYLSAEDLTTLYTGHEIASHSVTHPKFWEISLKQVEEEIFQDWLHLEKLVGYKIQGFVFPFNRGDSPEPFVQILKKLGLLYSRGAILSDLDFSPPQDFLSWHVHSNFRDVEKVWKPWSESQLENKVLHFCGHSWELDENNGWSEFESFWNSVDTSQYWFASYKEVYEYLSQSHFANGLLFASH